MSVKVVVSRGRNTIQEYFFPFSDSSVASQLNYYIGRSSECHIAIEDYNISRQHALLFFEDQVWKIKKISESSEVIVNGQAVDELAISQDDKVTIGVFDLNFDFSDTQTIYTNKDQKEEFTQVIENPSTEELEEVVDENTVIDDEFKDTETVLLGNTDESVEDDEDVDPLEENSYEEDSQEEYPSFEDDQFEAEFEESNSFGLEAQDDEGEKTQIFTSFVEFEVEISGPYANFDKYYVNKEEVFVGRDPSKCQIVLDDPESSQVHAVLKREGNSCIIEDLKSSNGTILNGQRLNVAVLKNGDEFIIGSTTFKMIVRSDLLKSQEDVLMPVDSTQEIEVEEIIEEEVDILDDEFLLEGDSEVEAPSSNALFTKDALKDPEKRKKILIIAVVLLGLWVLLDEEKPKQKPASKTTQTKDRSLFPDESQTTPDGRKIRTINDLTEELKNYVVQNYELGKSEVINGNFAEGLRYLDKVYEYVDSYKEIKDLEQFAKDELAKIEKLERERRAEEERREREIKVKGFLAKAQEAFEKERIELTQSFMNQILEIDPENLEVAQLKLQVENYIREQERRALEEAEAQARRDRLIAELKPGKTLFIKEKWYRAIGELERFLSIKDSDEDLIREAAGMLKTSQGNLKGLIGPLLGKARSLKEGQDYKGAYETYKEILEIDPTSEESLNEISNIKLTLDNQAKKVFREALIDESLSLLKNAKEKFQEVQQISPRDSDYYKKATAKLRNYLE